MASTFSPAKNHSSLHNFPLHNLKWSMNQSSAQRLRRPLEPTHLSPSRHSDQDHHRFARKIDNRLIKLSRPPNSSGSGNSGRDDLKTVSACEIRALNSVESSDKRLKLKKEEKVKGSHTHQIVVIRAPPKGKADTDAEDDIEWADDDEEPVAKTWNLRPRKAVTKPKNANGAPLPDNKPSLPAQTQPESTVTEPKVSKKKRKLSVSLPKEAIEEDFLTLTGSKPPRRPKKRVKAVQKLLDGLFPGLWLTSVTPNMYRVPEAPLKG
ncbi:hypothetical protein K1719_027442 [Acacia pycnantha]|nr:hypothetical protein K1719_027442 [Acacia pycnantha]